MHCDILQDQEEPLLTVAPGRDTSYGHPTPASGNSDTHDAMGSYPPRKVKVPFKPKTLGEPKNPSDSSVGIQNHVQNDGLGD